MTSAVALYGSRINRALQRRLRNYPLVIRTAAFVLMCAFGYGWLGAKLSHWLELGLHRLPLAFLAPTLLFLFIGVGLLAQRERQI